MDVIPSGVDELDAITGLGGFPAGAIVEISGLPGPTLEVLVRKVSQGGNRISPLRLSTPLSPQDWAQLEERMGAGTDLVSILASDAESADWLADPARARRLRGLAAEYGMLVVVAVQALLRITDVTRPPPQGLAAEADIRIRLSSHEDRPDRIVVQVVKNRFSRPGSESTLQLSSV